MKCQCEKNLFSVGLLLLYIVLPLDLIPDWLTLFGLIDDLAVFLFILQQVIKMAPVSLKRKTITCKGGFFHGSVVSGVLDGVAVDHHY